MANATLRYQKEGVRSSGVRSSGGRRGRGGRGGTGGTGGREEGRRKKEEGRRKKEEISPLLPLLTLLPLR